MPLLKIVSGARFTIYAWGDSNSCEFVDYLYDLKQASSPEYDKLFYLIKSSADVGPPRNVEKCRPIEGADGEKLFEFKTSGGVRALWFYDKGGRIVCTHAFGKCSAKELKKEIKKAKSIKDSYYKEQD